jgi:hypothetical protein
MAAVRIASVADLSFFSKAELRAIATRNLVECCAECRALLREQLMDEEEDDVD